MVNSKLCRNKLETEVKIKIDMEIVILLIINIHRISIKNLMETYIYIFVWSLNPKETFICLILHMMAKLKFKSIRLSFQIIWFYIFDAIVPAILRTCKCMTINAKMKRENIWNQVKYPENPAFTKVNTVGTAFLSVCAFSDIFNTS